MRGPYRFVRNLMISGVVFVLIAEALFFQSWPMAIWAIVFFGGNSVYFHWSRKNHCNDASAKTTCKTCSTFLDGFRD